MQTDYLYICYHKPDGTTAWEITDDLPNFPIRHPDCGKPVAVFLASDNQLSISHSDDPEADTKMAELDFMHNCWRYDLAPSDWNEHLINPQNGHNLKILGLLPKNRKYRILILDLNDMRRYKATSDFIKLCRPTA